MADIQIRLERRQIGTVEILVSRVYTLDPEADVTDMQPASAVVPPGEYPVYREGDTTYWMLTGNLNERGFKRLGDGMFEIVQADVPGEDQVTFASKRFGPREFTELLADPVCADGPMRRLVFRLEA